MRTQFRIQEHDPKKREEFFDYITSKYDFKIWYPYEKERFINNKFPFIVDFKEKSFWISELVTANAIASQHKLIMTIEEFKKEN